MATKTVIAIAQINLHVGNCRDNAEAIINNAVKARDDHHANLVVFPELTITGYPPEDLLLRNDFLEAAERAVEFAIASVDGIVMVFGHPLRQDGKLFNSATAALDGKIVAQYAKRDLPNYLVFDEKRYFDAGDNPCVFSIGDLRVGLTICEDAWNDGPVEETVAAGVDVLLNLNASPFHVGKGVRREKTIGARAKRNNVPIVYSHWVGGQDELVFDGSSFIVDGNGEVVMRAPQFREAVQTIEINKTGDGVTFANSEIIEYSSTEASVYQALVLGVRDYVKKNGFPGVVIGLSGGIDSALTLAVAVDALGADNVEAVLMPSRYTADMSIEDAVAEAEALGCAHHIVPIEPVFTAFLEQLNPMFEGLPVDTTEENIQARCRGVILMAVSNKTGKMVLTTGNKSEMSVGYATLYGDMVGGYSAIKDVPKTLVYELSRYRNRQSQVIPQRVIDRPPSAELAPDQKDEDSLPPYDILDPILEAYIEHDQSAEDIIEKGFDPETVYRVTRMVDRNEYKRRQAAPGVRITRRAFGRDRRYPITSAYRANHMPPEDVS